MPPNVNTQRSYLSATVIVVLFILYCGILWVSGLLRFDGSDSNVKILSAAFSLLAGFLSAVVALVGILLKYSIEERAEARLQIESVRNDILLREAEERLKLEAAIRAVPLLIGDDGRPSPPVQRVGALFTLVTLRQYGVCVALLNTLVPRGEVDPDTTTSVLNEVLLHGDHSQQMDAMLLLNRNAERLITDQSYSLPNCLFETWANLSPYVRGWAALLVANVIMARTRDEWLPRKHYLLGLISAIAAGWGSESDARIRLDIGAILYAILRAVPELRQTIETPHGVLDLADVWDETQNTLPTSDVGLRTIMNIRTWAGRGTAA